MTSAHDHRVHVDAAARELAVARYRAALAGVSAARDETVAELLDAYPFGRGLRSAPVRELLDHGCTQAQTRRILAALELADALEQLAVLDPGRRILNPAHAAQAGRAACRAAGDLEAEAFVVLGLDARQRIRLVRSVGIGSVAQVDVHPREVFRPVIRAGIHSVILVHNHPSGDPSPSEADVELTRRLVEAGRVVGIPVLDHIVVTAASYVSLAQLGMMSDP